MIRTLLALILLAGSTAPAAAADGAIRPAGRTVTEFLDCVRDRNVTLVTAHRGGVVGGLPENSMEAMQHTVAHIPTLLEVDVQRTKDGVLMLMHDDEVARTTTGKGKIADLTWAEVQTLQLVNHAGLKTPSRVPSLEQALEWARGRAVLQLDVKRGVPFAEVVAAVQKAKAHSYALLIVYNVEDAATVARLDPLISMNVNLSRSDEVERLVAKGVDLDRVTAFTGVNNPDPAYWAQLRKRGVSVGYAVLWKGDMEIATSGDDAEYARLGDAGADIIVTDRHFEAFRAIEKRQDTRAAVKACSAN